MVGLGEMTSHTLIDLLCRFIFGSYSFEDDKDGGGGRNRPTDILYTPTLKSLANFRKKKKIALLSLKVRAVFD